MIDTLNNININILLRKLRSKSKSTEECDNTCVIQKIVIAH